MLGTAGVATYDSLHMNRKRELESVALGLGPVWPGQPSKSKGSTGGRLLAHEHVRMRSFTPHWILLWGFHGCDSALERGGDEAGHRWPWRHSSRLSGTFAPRTFGMNSGEWPSAGNQCRFPIDECYTKMLDGTACIKPEEGSSRCTK